ncbi:hypothetical protein PR202_gb25704 [Eleusine coracana subsp. coracana]|uniref:Senescence-associated protein n=1 Tax=Eleusine coracana subsp. coracana TaxID=191504 RepID=A0AAV5FLZ4_ELECO|nr:hypothetical protein QOZ80_8BG0648630 [Eleusine coracana subsp. coracana]GJN36808.1 hypothetical protein PR202_gb25704 [Eleusine coracana subsp. coracana]
MARLGCSNAVFASFNVLTLLLGAAVLAGGIYLGAPHRGSSGAADCERFLRAPSLVLGAALIVVSAAGIAGACCRASILLWLYLLSALLILAAVGFTVFALVVTNAGAGRAVSGRGFREYRLGDYSGWLRRRVEDDKNWGRIRSCLAGARVCRSLQSNRTFDDFVNDNLSPAQSGCCKPPTDCNFAYLNETYWIKPPGPSNSSNPDCDTWSNDQSELCYGCQSCKAGVLGNLKNSWKKIAIINAAIIVLLIVVYSLGCCVLRSNRRHKYTLVGK